MRHVATALTIFGAGFVAGMLVPRAQQGAGCLGRRLAAPADLQASTLEDALGITPAVVRAIREEVRSMKLRPQSALKQHYKSRSILQDVFVRLDAARRRRRPRPPGRVPRWSIRAHPLCLE
jgi:hypothetical protein